MTKTTEPKGVVAMLSSPEGHTSAAHDFSKGGAAGFKQHEAQKMRARDKLYRAFIDDPGNHMTDKYLFTLIGCVLTCVAAGRGLYFQFSNRIGSIVFQEVLYAVLFLGLTLVIYD